jgi:hypothetical protein
VARLAVPRCSPHGLKNGTIFGKYKVMVLICSKTFFVNFQSKKLVFRTAGYRAFDRPDEGEIIK